MAFFTFIQNRSGGEYDFCPERGISRYVVIEAETASEANSRAEKIGIYFDGVENDKDCDCCGDRWSEVCDWCADEVPSIYEEPIQNHDFPRKVADGFPEAFVHFSDGRVVGYGLRERNCESSGFDLRPN